MSRREWLRLSSGLSAGMVLPGLARAQAWPSKAVRFVVPLAPGGSSDIVAMGEVARADDQHTVIPGHIGTLAVNPYIFDKLPCDSAKDFQPISLLSKVPSLYVVRADLPVNNLKQFIALAKAKPGALNCGSAGNRSAGHLAMTYLKMASGTFILHVPHRGTVPQLTDLVGGRLDAAAVGAPAVMQFIKTGQLRCIATGTTARLLQLPDVQTVAEQGYPGFEMAQWYGMLASASSPQALAETLSAAVAKAVEEPATSKLLESEAALVVGSSRAEFAPLVEQEQQRWKPVIARAKIKPD